MRRSCSASAISRRLVIAAMYRGASGQSVRNVTDSGVSRSQGAPCRRDDRFVCELRNHGEYGVEAQFLLNGDLYIARMFQDHSTTRCSTRWRRTMPRWVVRGPGRRAGVASSGCSPTLRRHEGEATRGRRAQLADEFESAGCLRRPIRRPFRVDSYWTCATPSHQTRALSSLNPQRTSDASGSP